MLVSLVAVVVMVFAVGTVVMATGGIGVSGVSESYRAAQEQRKECYEQFLQAKAPPPLSQLLVNALVP
nr:MAG TPA: hypothetical protein [Caudoviricetes sp.]